MKKNEVIGLWIKAGWTIRTEGKWNGDADMLVLTKEYDSRILVFEDGSDDPTLFRLSNENPLNPR